MDHIKSTINNFLLISIFIGIEDGVFDSGLFAGKKLGTG
jgi:hypothetical protein